jgi:putative inorganic carbon (HCO3(-)) transporter
MNPSLNSLTDRFWQTLTLSTLPLSRWQGSSYLSRPIGLLRTWRQGSWLMQWADPIGAAFVAIAFALAPFVSTALIGVLLIASAGFWVVLTLSDDAETRFSPIHLLVLLYWAIASVATALSPVKAAAFSGWVKLTLYLILFALMSRVLRSPRLRRWLIAVYLHVALIVSVYGLRQFRYFGVEEPATWTDPTSASADVTRVYSYLGNPNLLAGYLVAAVALSFAAIFAWREWGAKVLAGVMFVVNSACLVLTYSRGGWIGFVMAGFVCLVLLVYWWSPKLPKRWRKWAIPATIGIVAIAVLLAVMAVDPLRDRAMSIFAGREDSSNNFRINVWLSAIEMIRDRPIIGIGPGNDAFNKIYPLYMKPKYSALSAYSVLLETAIETGVVGLVAFLWLLLVALHQGCLHLQRLRQTGNPDGYWLIAAIATLAGMMMHGLVDTVWYRPQVNMLWWLAMAIVASYGICRQPQSRS